MARGKGFVGGAVAKGMETIHPVANPRGVVVFPGFGPIAAEAPFEKLLQCEVAMTLAASAISTSCRRPPGFHSRHTATTMIMGAAGLQRSESSGGTSSSR